jgi:hypothetical protein
MGYQTLFVPDGWYAPKTPSVMEFTVEPWAGGERGQQNPGWW